MLGYPTNNGTPSLKQRLRNGETVCGIFIAELRSPNLGTILESTGCDFGIFDMEHGSFTMQDLACMVPGFRGPRCRPLVRIPSVRREFIQSVLDLGVEGLVVPMVESPEEVHACLEMMKYPPAGKRGLSYCCPHAGFRASDRDRLIATANENLLLVVQIETATALENLDSILAVPGIDVVFIGNTDLALSLGQPNDLSGGQVHDAIRFVLQTAASKGIVGGSNFIDPRFGAAFYADGMRFISLDTDIERFTVGLESEMKKLKNDLRQFADPLLDPGKSQVHSKGEPIQNRQS